MSPARMLQRWPFWVSRSTIDPAPVEAEGRHCGAARANAASRVGGGHAWDNRHVLAPVPAPRKAAEDGPGAWSTRTEL